MWKRLSETSERESVHREVIEVAAFADVYAIFCMLHGHLASSNI